MAQGDIIGDVIGGAIGNIVPGLGGGSDTEQCSKTGVTDSGLLQVSTIRTALATAVAALNVKTARDMAKLQKEIAEDYTKLAEDARDYYNDVYKPLETQTLNEVSSEAKYVRDKDDITTGQMLLSVRGQLVGAIEDKLRCTGRYCTGQRAALINDELLKQANAEAAVAGMAFRFEDAKETAKNTLRWECRREVLNLGRDIPTKAVAYAELASGIFGSIGKQSSASAEGIAWWLGNRNNRRDTEYPTRPEPLRAGQGVYTPRPIIKPAEKPAPIYKEPAPKTIILE